MPAISGRIYSVQIEGACRGGIGIRSRRIIPSRIIHRDNETLLLTASDRAGDLSGQIHGRRKRDVQESFSPETFQSRVTLPDDTLVVDRILSATARIRGRAIQTDAKISPNNFGGPLIDLEGNLLGILVPLSPNNTEITGGSDWYDSGIGFAQRRGDSL